MQHDPLVVVVAALVILGFLVTVYAIVRRLSIAAPRQMAASLTALATLVGILASILYALHSLLG